MDTKEDIEIKKTIASGGSHTDEGPYYHGAWWESYKGSVKGELGGAFIGALVGSGAGLLAATALSFIVTGGISFLLVTAGFAAAGTLYGAHEFNGIGKVTGAVASAHEKSEERMKNFENGKFLEIKKEIGELRSLITGEPVTLNTKTDATETMKNTDDYPTQHVDENAQSKGFRPIFWKIAAIGLVVGLGIGALIAFGGLAEPVLHMLGAAVGSISQDYLYTVSMTTFGLFGASFGVNRDIFRSIFDKTDHLFKGILFSGKNHSKVVEPIQSIEQHNEKQDAAITTVVYSGYLDYPQSDTHHREKVLTQAKEALLGMDHTKAMPH